MYRKPIRPASHEPADAQGLENAPESRSRARALSRRAVYNVLWRKKTLKVHKTWEGDGEGCVVINSAGDGSVLVVTADGLNLGSVKLGRSAALEEGQVLSSGRFEFEIGTLVSTVASAPPSKNAVFASRTSVPAEFSRQPRTVVTAASSSSQSRSSQSGSPHTPFSGRPSSPPSKLKSSSSSLRSKKTLDASPSVFVSQRKVDNISSATFQRRPNAPVSSAPENGSVQRSTNPSSKDSPSDSVYCEKQTTSIHQGPRSKLELSVATASQHLKRPARLGMAPIVGNFGAPLQLDPFIPLRPNQSIAKRQRVRCPEQGCEIDAALVERLRPHQIEAVKFLYDSVTGVKHVYGQGAILADEMGLGKSLTAITLIDTLLRTHQIKHALIVCPVTLISNWRAEFRKWLPAGSRVGVMIVDQRGLGNGSLKDPARAFFGDRSFRVHQVMIVGYERMRLLSTTLVDENKQFDLVVCDEGHKLKSAGSKTAEAIASVVGDKRVLLTGTPIQNNLNEFWALADFVNPGCFGSEAQFTRKFIAPLDSSPSAAHDALDELSDACDEFMLRRDASVLAQYLSVPKTEYAVFCRPTVPQGRRYAALTMEASQLVGSGAGCLDQSACLQAIAELKKAASGLTTQGGGKVVFLKHLLEAVRKRSSEKIVIVSGSTKVLDLCQELCGSMRLQWLRLDGQTPQERRQGIVDKFNKQPPDAAFAFLLSSRSGGMGLNLTGGSRLVLMDCDWNPSIDAQAMARIHRDGQRRACRIYRLFTAGTVDEKIFQRQLSKLGLATNVLVEAAGANARTAPQFTREQLQDLLSYSEPELCNTLDMLPEFEALKGYTQATAATDDDILDAAISAAGNVSCILVRK